MAQTVANLADVMKEVWTGDRLEKQFYDEFPVFDRLKRVNKWTHGKSAVVPIHAGRSGGYSVVSSAGSSALNAADEQKVDRATYNTSYNWFQIELETAAINEATGGGFSVGSAVDLEVNGALSDIRNQVQRQFLGDNTGLIAATTTTSNSATVNLDPAGYGYDAIVRGWLYPGLRVDVGTAADPDADTTASEIVSVTENAADPEVTISTAITCDGNDRVSVGKATQAGGNTSNESDGLRNIAGSTTNPSGTLDPDTAGVGFWKPAHVDTSTTVLSLNLLLTLQRKVRQKTGKGASSLLFSLYQQQNLYELLQSQVQFGSDSVTAGADQRASWNGMSLDASPPVPDREVYMLTLDDLAVVTGAKIKQPTWASSLQGGNTGMLWSPGTTKFVDGLVFPIGLACQRRNSHASAIGLTA